MASESDSSYSDYNTSDILNQYENIMINSKEKSHSTDDLTKLIDEYDKLSIKSMKQQLKETNMIGPNTNTKHKSMIKKKRTSTRNKKKVGFHDNVNLIIDEQTSFRTRSVSLSKLSNGSDDNISLKNILDAHQKYYVIDKLVFRIVNVNWNGWELEILVSFSSKFSWIIYDYIFDLFFNLKFFFLNKYILFKTRKCDLISSSIQIIGYNFKYMF